MDSVHKLVAQEPPEIHLVST